MATSTVGKVLAETVPAIDAITIHSKTGVSLEFVFIPPGDYVVGRNIGNTELVLRALGQQAGALNEGPERRIKLTRGFYLGRHQIMASQFAEFLNDVDSDTAERSIKFYDGCNFRKDTDGYHVVDEEARRYPADAVTWDGAVEFTKWFTKKTGWCVRLPTEDEWEAATRTPQGFLTPTGGPERKVDPKTGLLPGIRAGSAHADVDAFDENITVNGLFNTLSYVGDWTSSAYRGDRGNRLPDALFAEDNGGHVAKRCSNQLTEREPGDEKRVFGMRVLLEATESGSPKRKHSDD